MHHTCPNSKCEYHGFRGLGNFIRPHMALKSGRTFKTPAMQAGWLTGR